MPESDKSNIKKNAGTKWEFPVAWNANIIKECACNLQILLYFQQEKSVLTITNVSSQKNSKITNSVSAKLNSSRNLVPNNN